MLDFDVYFIGLVFDDFCSSNIVVFLTFFIGNNDVDLICMVFSEMCMLSFPLFGFNS